jgi:hypothetical protein
MIYYILSDDNEIKLEINNKRKYPNTGRQNNSFFSDPWVIKEIKDEIKKFLESSENNNTTYQNLSRKAKAVLKRFFFPALNLFIYFTFKKMSYFFFFF